MANREYLTETAEWKELSVHFKKMYDSHLRDLFQNEGRDSG